MEVYFMRHGDASYDAPSDETRELTELGIQRSRKTGKLLHKLGIEFDHIYASPRVRAQQTAACVAEVYKLQVVTSAELDFEFDVNRLKTILEGHPDKARVLLVGHNPNLSEVVQAVTGAIVDLGKGAVGRMDIHLPAVRGSQLKWLLTPKMLEAL